MNGLDRLAELDAAPLSPTLSPANTRACWAAAVDGARRVDLGRPLPGPLPACVTIVASANVFTAPMEWAWALGSRGVHVILKSARGLTAVGEALASALPNVEHRGWRGGDEAAEAEALAESNAAIVFGSAETIAAIRARSPVPVLGFGPRFGLGFLDREDHGLFRGVARDHALYDGRGCMSPAAVVVSPEVDVDDVAHGIAAAMEAAEAALPLGEITATEAAELRALALLGRVEGREHSGRGWLVVTLPLARLRPRALPRAVVLHSATLAAVAPAIAPWRAELGTLAVGDAAEDDLRNRPDLAAALGLMGLPPARVCALGEMQRPPGDRALHDGIDVLAALAHRG